MSLDVSRVSAFLVYIGDNIEVFRFVTCPDFKIFTWDSTHVYTFVMCFSFTNYRRRQNICLKTYHVCQVFIVVI